MRLGEWEPAGLAARARSLWRGLRHRDSVEAEMVQEFRHHLELRTAELMRGGLTRVEAARQAHVEFGHVESHRIDARASRGLASVDQLRFSGLDIKLGVRMLAKYPGLSLVAGIGMAAVIAITVGAFSVIASLMATSVPLPGGDRIVALRNASLAEPGQHRASLRDFTAWRSGLTSVRDLAAFTTGQKNLQIPGAAVELIPVVRMTASGFDVARTVPVLGRPLLAEDERTDAHVVVIGFDEWQRRFAGNPAVIGRPVRLGADVYTVVGVMPEGFRFPVDDHYWIPLVFAREERARADEVSLTIFGRLADGSTIDRAQAELTTIGTRMAAAYPETHKQLRAQVLPYPRAYFDIDNPEIIWSLFLFRLFVCLLLVVIAVNVAVLVYARTATRAGEIAVRTALGASRARVVAQLFAEALVLCVLAAAIGLTITQAGLAKMQTQTLAEAGMGQIPFWVNLGLSPSVVGYALLFAIVGAVIVGVVPALKATGRRVQSNLQQLSGHGARMQLGRGWTALIVAQVAVAVAVLPFAAAFTQDAIGDAAQQPGYPADEFLEASLAMESPDAPRDTGAARRAVEQRLRAGSGELIRRLESDPAVAGVTVRVGDGHDRIELENVGSAPQGHPIGAGTRRVDRVDRVDARYFALYGMPLLSGRAFSEPDARVGGTAVIVNQVFVNQVFGDDNLGGGMALGRRLRFVSGPDTTGAVEASPWLEIVGVVRDFEEQAHRPSDHVYLPADVAQLSAPISLAVRIRGRPATRFAPRLREIAAAVDPALQVNNLTSAAERYRQRTRFFQYLAFGTTAAMLSVVLLSAAGIYAMMSFTVARRRREIGIRSALGADSRRVLTSIFARASTQLTAGLVLGLAGCIALDHVTGRGPLHDGNPTALVLVAALMTTVGLFAAIGPARRGLAVQPTEALREE